MPAPSALAARGRERGIGQPPRGAGADRQQRDFIGKRNASFGRPGYDLRAAMEERLEKLNTIAR